MRSRLRTGNRTFFAVAPTMVGKVPFHNQHYTMRVGAGRLRGRS